MCGIAGYVHIADTAVPQTTLNRMMETIRHRGPDASGVYRDRWASLGHQRLSIIDLDTGQQPMSNEDQRLWIVYNGEIFNHAAIRQRLEPLGHHYKSRSDTETILHAYEQYGEDCVQQFRGMFAFVIWNKDSRTLFAARDRLGIKPFYYYWDGHVFAFASEIKALLEHPAITPAFEDAILPEYLAFGFLNEERTFFSGIRKLMPGHHLQLTLEPRGGLLQIRQYWDLPEPQPNERDDHDWILECRRRLEESVQMRLMSDVPLGVFLSGGIDSAAIAALMTRTASDPIKTFTVGYRESEFSELDHARQVSRHLGTEHREVIIGTDDFFSALPKLIWHEDEPIFWPSSVALYFVSQLAAAHVKVVLTGEGSDEMFGGYGRYAYYLMNKRCMDTYRHLPIGIRNWVRVHLGALRILSPSLQRKLRHTFVGCTEEFESLQLDNFYAAFLEADQDKFFKGPLGHDGAPYTNYMAYFNANGARSPLSRMLHADVKTYLVELLMKQDQMSMACSIESRVPFLDHPFVEFSVHVPDHLKIRGRTGKFLLKEAVRDLLPPEAVHRRKKGFPTPFHRWVKGANVGPLVTQLLDRQGLLASYFDMSKVAELLAEHRQGRIDATDRIWRLLNLQIWGDIFLLKRREVAVEVPHRVQETGK